jgi:cell division protein FtsL
MATLANIFNNFMGAGSVAESAARTATRQVSDMYTLRAVPNEDVYFFTKRIDNSRVLRQADPKARARDWKMVGGAGFAAISLIAMLLPSAYGLMAGYQLSSLKKEQQHLVTERARLNLEEARLISAERLQELARMQDFVDPAPDRTVYLTPKNDKSLALNRR